MFKIAIFCFWEFLDRKPTLGLFLVFLNLTAWSAPNVDFECLLVWISVIKRRWYERTHPSDHFLKSILSFASRYFCDVRPSMETTTSQVWLDVDEGGWLIRSGCGALCRGSGAYSYRFMCCAFAFGQGSTTLFSSLGSSVDQAGTRWSVWGKIFPGFDRNF